MWIEQKFDPRLLALSSLALTPAHPDTLAPAGKKTHKGGLLCRALTVMEFANLPPELLKEVRDNLFVFFPLLLFLFPVLLEIYCALSVGNLSSSPIRFLSTLGGGTLEKLPWSAKAGRR